MKQLLRSHSLPVLPAAAGVLGLLLRIWLFSAIDEKGLLPAKHFADTAVFLLTAIVLGLLFLITRKPMTRPVRKGVPALAGIAGCAMGGIGFLCTGLGNLSAHTARFSGIATLAGIVGGLALLAMAVLKYFRKRAGYGFPAIVTVCLMLDTVAQCQVWGAASQLQEYFFPLMASVFLILTAYHATFLAAGQGKPQQLAFFSQGALFFCCTCLNTIHWMLYLGMLFWAAAQLYPCIRKRKEA